MDTYFAPAERSDENKILEQYNLIMGLPFIPKMMNSTPSLSAILNRDRQIVFANDSLMSFLGIKDMKEILGKRPGEAISCIHSDEMEGGCGTTEYCSVCGAVRAIMSCIDRQCDVQECRITTQKGGALDLKTWTTPFETGGNFFIFMFIADISHEKRRRLLERIFFHDILNTAGGVQGFAELLKESEPEEYPVYANTVCELSENLIEEIRSQQYITSAENNELIVHPKVEDTIEILREVFYLYKSHPTAEGKKIRIEENSLQILITTDANLLRRVLGNMVKNALEASQPGDTVTIGCEWEQDEIAFWVNNPSFMPRDVQLQIFQRSFSTKGKDRGLGTYSIKLLSERYLGGRVSFTSSPEQGTTFTVILPPGINQCP